MSYFTLIVRLSDGETWNQLTHFQTRAPLEFETETQARDYLTKNFPTALQGEHIRWDVFHGLQPVRVVMVNRKGA